jgi:hypothetical protein
MLHFGDTKPMVPIEKNYEENVLVDVATNTNLAPQMHGCPDRILGNIRRMAIIGLTREGTVRLEILGVKALRYLFVAMVLEASEHSGKKSCLLPVFQTLALRLVEVAKVEANRKFLLRLPKFSLPL